MPSWRRSGNENAGKQRFSRSTVSLRVQSIGHSKVVPIVIVVKESHAVRCRRKWPMPNFLVGRMWQLELDVLLALHRFDSAFDAPNPGSPNETNRQTMV